MAWQVILWIVFSVMNLALLGFNFYQFLGFSDLEADYLNPYELSSRINSVIVIEYLLHGAFCILFLVTGHWIMFLLSLPPAYYNLKQYLSRQHLIDVTEVFRVLNSEKKVRIIKLGFYIIFFALVFTRTVAAGAFSAVLSVLYSIFVIFYSPNSGDYAIHSTFSCLVIYWLALSAVFAIFGYDADDEHWFGLP